MAKEMETYVLAEMRTVTLEGGGSAELIRSIVRTFESAERADQDLALLTQTLTDLRYRVFPVEHLDR